MDGGPALAFALGRVGGDPVSMPVRAASGGGRAFIVLAYTWVRAGAIATGVASRLRDMREHARLSLP